VNSHEFGFQKGEHITTEYSYKYAPEDFERLAIKAGFESVKNWEDPDHLFSVLFLQVGERAMPFNEGFRRVRMKRLTKLAIS
jgi:hypothetical protein